VLFIIDDETDFPREVAGVETATARSYLTGTFANGRHERIVNLCGMDRAQNPGFYVSLLAEARDHQPLPSAKTIEDLRDAAAAAAAAPGLEKLATRLLAGRAESSFEMHSFFGFDPAAAHDELSRTLFDSFQAPLLRARFVRNADQWKLAEVSMLSAAEARALHPDALLHAAAQYVAPEARRRPGTAARPAIAILYTADQELPPSNPAALKKFVQAAHELGMRAEIVDQGALDRLERFDGLFIRDTTFLDHYTYRFAQRAAALGLVVVDDPEDIVQCANKVYLNELLARHRIVVPRTLMVHRENIADIVPTLGLPCILKQPDGGFSVGVRMAKTAQEVRAKAESLLEKSELIIAQEFLPTDFDWRVTVFERRPLFVCQYFMAPGHWQVHKYEPDRHLEGRTVALSVGEAPKAVVEVALQAANLIGDGFYGVDLKQAGQQCYVIEINDNPNVDAGNEDGILKDALYREIMGVFKRRITERRECAAAHLPAAAGGAR
jgi:glutathione synthase/RimK-type ligase-like ATP-grasp enzyme